MRLLSLEIKGSSAASTGTEPANFTDEAWERQEDDTSLLTSTQPLLGLWQVERRLFEGRESAQEVLEDLGLELLADNLGEARQILRRRVELAA